MSYGIKCEIREEGSGGNKNDGHQRFHGYGLSVPPAVFVWNASKNGQTASFARELQCPAYDVRGHPKMRLGLQFLNQRRDRCDATAPFRYN